VKITTVCWMLILFSSCFATAQEHQRFISFDVPGAIDMGPTSITPDGKITGLYTSADGHQHGFLLNDGKYKPIDFPGSTETAARSINPRGEIVGEYTDAAGKIHGFSLVKGKFTSFDYPSAVSTTAFGIGTNGDIVGPYTTLPFTFHGFLLRRGSFSEIEYPGAMWTLPTMIVGRSIVGGYFDDTFTSHGFLLDHGVFQEIVCPGYSHVFLSGLNSLGDMTGGFNSSDGLLHGLLVKNGTCISIDYPGSTSTYANAEDPGSRNVVGRYTDNAGKAHGFLLVREGEDEKR
jgi:uncharacterized membrane protein